MKLTNFPTERPQTSPLPVFTPLNLSLSKPQNITPDVKYEHLKQFLDNVTNVINQHAGIINEMQQEIAKKTNDGKLLTALSQISQDLTLFDQELEGNARKNAGKPKNEASGNEFEDALNKTCNKVALFSQFPGLFAKKLAIFEEKLKDLDAQNAKKLDFAAFKAKSQRQKSRVATEIKEIKAFSATKAEEIERKVRETLGSWEEKLRETEKNTLWRIQDCEELLKKRVNDELLDSSLRSLEEKLRKSLGNSTENAGEAWKTEKDELERKLKESEEKFAEKIKSTRKIVKEVEEKYEFLAKLTSFIGKFLNT